VIPLDEGALKKLEKVVEENKKAGDWLYGSLPTSPIPVPLDRELSDEDILDILGNNTLPSKKR
jgi:hypothetical protein